MVRLQVDPEIMKKMEEIYNGMLSAIRKQWEEQGKPKHFCFDFEEGNHEIIEDVIIPIILDIVKKLDELFPTTTEIHFSLGDTQLSKYISYSDGHRNWVYR